MYCLNFILKHWGSEVITVDLGECIHPSDQSVIWDSTIFEVVTGRILALQRHSVPNPWKPETCYLTGQRGIEAADGELVWTSVLLIGTFSMLPAPSVSLEIGRLSYFSQMDTSTLKSRREPVSLQEEVSMHTPPEWGAVGSGSRKTEVL